MIFSDLRVFYQTVYPGDQGSPLEVDIDESLSLIHIYLEAYNEKEGLTLSKEEMDYLKKVEQDLGRKLTRCV